MIIVVGGGAAGLMAAGKAAEAGAEVLLMEKNERVGKKLGITGKGRCNITNAGDITEFMKNFSGNGQFLYGALAKFSNHDLMNFFTTLKVELKVERGKRVFPASDSSRDVVEALESYVRDKRVTILFNTKVKEIIVEDGQISGVFTADGEFFKCHAVILATGGASYPGTGSTGDGYGIASALGHKICLLRPSLVPLECQEEWPTYLRGLTLKNVTLSAYQEDKLLGAEFGEMLFTNFGISGPIVLTLSEKVSYALCSNNSPVRLSINLKPALSQEQLDARLQRDFAFFSNRQLKNSLNKLLPKSFIPIFLSLTDLDDEKKANQITREERERLVHLLQNIPLTVKGTRPMDEAIITAGGVDTREVDPRTMESRLITGLFFAGEVVDIHGNTGGYNLQAAFSTGTLAGTSAAKYSFSRL